MAQAVLTKWAGFAAGRKPIEADSSGNIALGPEFSGSHFLASVNEAGELVLQPIPDEELWLYRDPEALSRFRAGMADMASGKRGVTLDFSQYGDVLTEDE